MDTGKITASYEEKLQMIRVIRSFRPDIIITQDTEHCVYDLDPGRRPFMTLVLEAMALAGKRICFGRAGWFKTMGQFYNLLYDTGTPKLCTGYFRRLGTEMSGDGFA